MPSSCIFELNKPQAIYFSGETISGRIILNTTNDKNVRDVSIIILGEGKVKWEESSSSTNSDGSSSSSTTYYKSHEIYVNNSTSVHGDGVLPLGKHTYTFNIPLPLECPTSIEGKYGHIRYEIILKINRYYRFDNIYKKPITIIKNIDLNLNPNLKQPVCDETVKTVGIKPFSSGKIFCTLKAPFGAFAPGQLLKYALHIKNQSKSDIEGYFVEFKKKITFTANSPSKSKRSTKDILASKSCRQNCLRLTNRVIEGEIYIPSTPPSTLPNDIIYVEYKLKVILQLSGLSSNMELKIPIIIGTIPIMVNKPNYQYMTNRCQQQAISTTVENTAPTAPGSEEILPPNYDDLFSVPPTFEEATSSSAPFIDTDIEPQNRIEGFKPLYPMYKK
ncbi:arrestin domain-containing protein 3-like [Cochliomyia hominivorax]